MTSGIAVHDMTATQWSLSGPTGPPAAEHPQLQRSLPPLVRRGAVQTAVALGHPSPFWPRGWLYAVRPAGRPRHSHAGGQPVINLTGAVHDLICRDAALVMARVDRPILYSRY